jgi:Na+/proline symporter
MKFRRKIKGGIVGFIGFMLSPLSWWNDLFVNVPLALAFAWFVSLFWPRVFEASAIVGYWLTNIVGLVLLHRGARDLLSQSPSASRKELLVDLLVSVLYTLVIVALLKLKLVEPLPNYFAPRP